MDESVTHNPSRIFLAVILGYTTVSTHASQIFILRILSQFERIRHLCLLSNHVIGLNNSPSQKRKRLTSIILVDIRVCQQYILRSHGSRCSAIPRVNRGGSTWSISLCSRIRFRANLVGAFVGAEREKTPIDRRHVRFLHILDRECGRKRSANGSDLSVLRWCLRVLSARRRGCNFL